MNTSTNNQIWLLISDFIKLLISYLEKEIKESKNYIVEELMFYQTAIIKATSLSSRVYKNIKYHLEKWLLLDVILNVTMIYQKYYFYVYNLKVLNITND